MRSVAAFTLVIAFVVAGMTAASAQVTASSDARVSQDVQAISKMVDDAWEADLKRIPACHLFKQSGDGFIGKVNNMKEAIACWSAADHVASCGSMALQAASSLDLVRTGQTTFAELTSETENKPGAGADETNGLSLAESAPAAMSPLQLGRAIYEQCLSAPQLK